MTNEQSISASGASEIIAALGDNFVVKADVCNIIFPSDATEKAVAQKQKREALSVNRFDEFKNALLANKQLSRYFLDASADPHFVTQIRKAAGNYIDSGDTELLKDLSCLIGRLAMEKNSRLRICLSDALNRCNSLTQSEFATLSLLFFVQKVSIEISSVDQLGELFLSHGMTMIDRIDDVNRSIDQLISAGCAINTPVPSSFIHHMRINFPKIISDGVDYETLKSFVAEGYLESAKNQGLIVEAGNSLWKPNQTSRDRFISQDGVVDITRDLLHHIWDCFLQTCWNKKDFIDRTRQYAAMFEKLDFTWDNTNLYHTNINTIGVAIGHTHLQRITAFNLDLSRWIS